MAAVDNICCHFLKWIKMVKFREITKKVEKARSVLVAEKSEKNLQEKISEISRIV